MKQEVISSSHHLAVCGALAKPFADRRECPERLVGQVTCCNPIGGKLGALFNAVPLTVL